MTQAIVRHHYEPRGAAKALLECRDAEVLLSGPAGTGKSRAALEKLHFMALLNPGMRGLIIRKTRESLTSTGLVTWRQKVVAEGLTTGVLSFYGGSAAEPSQYRYSNGSSIVVGGMDKAMKIMSSDYDVIYVQEATELTVDDWEALTTRLRNGVVSFQQLIADCNPNTPHHWLNLRAQQGQTTMLNSAHEDNPMLFGPDGTLTAVGTSYIAKLDALTGVRYLRLRKGLWAAAEGLVYEDFDPAVHLVDSLPSGSEHWTRWWSVDFGYTNPFVWQSWAEDPDGRMWLYREIYKTQELVEDHARHMIKLTQQRDGTWVEPRPRAIVCDHDAEDRATLERHLGISTVAAHKAKSPGIQAVQSRLRVQPDGKPRIFLVRTALHKPDKHLVDAKKPVSTIDEITGYVWPPNAKPGQREDPVKENDHGMDAMRYIVAERDLRARPQVRWM